MRRFGGIMRGWLIGVGLIASLTSSGALAQTPTDAGMTVRIHSVDRGTEPITGFLVSATSESFVIREKSGRTEVISPSTIEKIEVTEKRRRHAGHGAIMGLVSGATTGGLWGALNDESFQFRCDGDVCGDDAAAMGAYLLGLVGALGGALVGGLIRTDDWVEVTPDLLYADRSTEELATFLRRARDMRAFPLSVELGLGPGFAGHGGGLSGQISVRLVPKSWGVGVRLMGMDGARRRATSCFIFCNPIESFTEKSVLIHRRIDRSDQARFYLGAGVGRLTGRRFIGSGTEFDRDVSELGLSFEASAYVQPGSRVRFSPTLNGHLGSGGLAIAITFGMAFGG